MKFLLGIAVKSAYINETIECVSMLRIGGKDDAYIKKVISSISLLNTQADDNVVYESITDDAYRCMIRVSKLFTLRIIVPCEINYKAKRYSKKSFRVITSLN